VEIHHADERRRTNFVGVHGPTLPIDVDPAQSACQHSNGPLRPVLQYRASWGPFERGRSVIEETLHRRVYWEERLPIELRGELIAAVAEIGKIDD
jgi:hypothetical protein